MSNGGNVSHSNVAPLLWTGTGLGMVWELEPLVSTLAATFATTDA